MTLDSKRWYVIQTLSRLEALATLHLKRQGYETFLPLTRTTRRHARSTQTAFAALFPRYAFVRLNLARDRWRSINGTVGVVSLVMGREMPLPVPDGVVENLVAATGNDGVTDPQYQFAPGNLVCLAAGPLAGSEGTLVSIGAKGRVEILLSLLSGTVRAYASADNLRPVL